MRKILMLWIAAMLIVGFSTTADALLIGEGATATYSFDFTGDLLAPPYYGYDLQIQYDYFVNSQTGTGNFSWTGSDATGVWSSYGGSAAWVNDGSTTAGYGRFNPNTTLSSEWTQYINITVNEGSIDLSRVYLQMRGADSADYTLQKRGSLYSVSVPDASIMLLLGSSLMGLAVFRKKSKRI